MSSAINIRPPLISVIGATGTGKSNLAVDLALALNGEIINADAMQMYEGLPIITNKITPTEAKGIPHHLLGFLNVRDAWRVDKFTKEAERIITDIRTRGKLPILVGGTHYYIQSLLFPHSTPTDTDTDDPPDHLEEKYPILTAPTPELYTHLQSIDPLIASRWHPNDRRKILRSLKIYYASGATRTASEVYADQRSHPSNEAAPYRNLIFWVHADPEVLKTRLDERVDKMITGGMWQEIEEMKRVYDTALIHNIAVGKGGGAEDGRMDLGSGIWQSIGFKEFLPFLQQRDSFSTVGEEEEGRVNPEEETRVLDELRGAAVADMKASTRQYARSQIKWIRIKFMNALQPSSDTIFLLDSTDITKFTQNVSTKGVDIAKDFLNNNPLPDPLGLSPLAATSLPPKRDYDFSHRPDLWVQRVCEVCDVTCINEDQWKIHERSQRHKKAVSRERRRPEVEAFIRMRKEKEGGGD